MKQFITLIPYSRISFIAGVITFVGAIAGFLVIGGIYTDTQARGLVEAMTPAVHTLCFAVITSVSTIIPLMLTMLGLTRRVDQEFDDSFYKQVKIIAMLGTVALISSTLLLLFLSIPITETESLHTWFSGVYVVVILGSAWIASLLVSVVITLYRALMGIMHILTPSHVTDFKE